MIDGFCYTLIVTRTLGHILSQILVAKILINHGDGDRFPELLILISALEPFTSKQSADKWWGFEHLISLM